MGEKERPDTDIRDSNPNANGPDGAAGGMGVSSERTGPTGPGQESHRRRPRHHSRRSLGR